MFFSKVLGLSVVASAITSTYAACNKNCNGHGTCGAYDRCDCFQAYANLAEDCSQRNCPYGNSWATLASDPHKYSECSDAGVCNRGTGLCECFDGYTGHACQRSKCQNDCSGNGQCVPLRVQDSTYTGWDKNKIQVCKCDPGYEGPSCSRRKCPLGDDPLTLNYGSGAQVDEVQQCILTGTGDLAGRVAIEYEDWQGTKHITRALDVDALSTTVVKEALQALPNNALPEVTVGFTDNTNSITFTVTFTSASTPGTQNLMRVLYGSASENHSTAGNQPKYGLTANPPASGSAVACTRVTVGTEEAKTCSGRGTCNHESGKCVCNVGFQGHSCNVQTTSQ